MSVFFQVLYVECFTRSRYQVSVYRIPMVLWRFSMLANELRGRPSMDMNPSEFIFDNAQRSSSPKTAWPMKAKFYMEPP